MKPKDKSDPKAMTGKQAKAFGCMTVEFGKYRGQRYDDVPLDYWEWLADENNKVQRYLRSRKIREELQNG